MIVARRDGHAITRKSSFFKNNSLNMFDDSYSDYEEQKNEINEPESKITLSCSTKCATTLWRLWYELNEKMRKKLKLEEWCNVVFIFEANWELT